MSKGKSTQQAPPRDVDKQTKADERGSDKSPITVKVLPATQTDQETADAKAQRDDQSAANWWMVRLTFAVVIVGVMQTIVFGIQARRLKQTIVKMEEISTTQTGDIQASIAQASRAAKGIEDMAGFVAQSVESNKLSADAAQTSALAAKASADALMSIERAWLVIDQTVASLDSVTIRLSNFGKTPAFLTALVFQYTADSQKDIWPIDFESIIQELGTPEIVAVGSHTRSFMARLLLGENTEPNGTNFKHYYGMFRYKDIFGNTHNTPVYGVYEAGNWLTAGPPEANRPT